MSASSSKQQTTGRAHRILMRVLMAFIVVGALQGAIMLALDSHDSLSERLLLTWGIVIMALSVLVACSAIIRRARQSISMGLAMAACMIGSGLLLVLVWFERDIPQAMEEFIGRSSATFLGLAIALAHTGLFGLIKARSRLVRGLRVATMAVVWLLTADIFLLAWADEALFEVDFSTAILLLILTGTLAVVALAGTVITPLAALSQANTIERAAESIDSRVRVSLGCPKCGHRQELRTGHVRCAACGAGLFIEVQEPRCECGYLLYRLDSDTCPECGRAIEARPALAGAGADGQRD